MPRLAGVQILRLSAALIVVVQHAIALAMDNLKLPPDPLFLRLDLGALGVYLFFAVSGYVIGRQAEMSPKRFALHRLVRIYPAYAIALAISVSLVVMTGIIPIWDIRFDWSLLLVPAGTSQRWSALPYWTLIYEVFFYAVAFLLMSARSYDPGLVLWAAIILLGSAFYPPPKVPTFSFTEMALSPLCLIFIAGAAYARLEMKRSWPAILITLGLIIALYYEPSQRMRVCAAASLGFVLLIHLSIRLERYFHNPVGLLLAHGGDWSYGLYLLHFALIGAVLAVAGPINPALALLIAIPVATVGGLAFGAWEHLFYTRYLKPLVDRRSPSPLVPQAGSSREDAESPGRARSYSSASP